MVLKREQFNIHIFMEQSDAIFFHILLLRFIQYLQTTIKRDILDDNKEETP